tara:strand:- start:1483 stop:2817 length:1335 start_codon:yes stop_codon:yes gene_type:complete
MDLKPNPHSQEAEEACLGCILNAGEETYDIYEKALKWVRKPEAMYMPENEIVWNAITDLYKNNKVIDPITVTDACKDNMIQTVEGRRPLGGSYILSLTDNVPSVRQVETYAKIIWERYIQRKTAESAYNLYNSSFKDYDEVNILLENHARLIDELKRVQPSHKKDLSLIANQALQEIRSGANLTKFGMPQLDWVAGGMSRGEITVVGGRPGHGKSTLAVNIIKGLVENKTKVLVFNREMTSEEIWRKLMVMESKTLSYQKMRRGMYKNNKEIDSLDKIMRVKYSPYLTMMDNIRNLNDTMREVSKVKPKVIIDDYIQLINVEGKSDRRFEIEQILYEYKWICKQYDISAILISQLNREVERRIDPEPRLSDFAESGVIEQTAETALLIFYGFAFDSSRFDRNTVKLIAAKARYGVVGHHVVGFDGDKCKVYPTVEEAKNAQRKE